MSADKKFTKMIPAISATRDTDKKIRALSAIRGLPIAAIVREALNFFLANLSTEDHSQMTLYLDNQKEASK